MQNSIIVLYRYLTDDRILNIYRIPLYTGWVLGDYNGTEVLMHGGDTFTTHTFITLSREKEYGIFVSSTGGFVGELNG